jgi:hypothetical protein
VIWRKSVVAYFKVLFGERNENHAMALKYITNIRAEYFDTKATAITKTEENRARERNKVLQIKIVVGLTF